MASTVKIQGNIVDMVGTIERSMLTTISNCIKLYKLTDDPSYKDMANDIRLFKDTIDVKYDALVKEQLEVK